MKKGYNRIIIIEAVLLIFLLFNSFVFKIANAYVVTGIMLPFLILMFVIMGYEKDSFRNKKDVLLNMSIILLMLMFLLQLQALH